MAKDYYAILGIDKSASQDDIKKAFRKMAHKYHPDKGNGDEAKFKEANEAYQVLSNPEKRKQYDQFGQTFDQGGFGGGQAGQNPFSGFGNFQGGFADVDIDEIFGDFFGGFGGRTRSRQERTNRGRDLEIGITIDFKDAALGVKRDIHLRKNVVCETCDGNGAKKGSDVVECTTCQGTGRVTHVRQTFLGNVQTQSICNDCNGQGKQIKEKCPECRGSGQQEKETTLHVDIPGGVESGHRVRMSGAGDAGKFNGPAGDLYININVTPHPDFKRNGETIFSTTIIPFSVAVFGDKIAVKTVDGDVQLKIPSGTKSGKQFQLKNKGAYRLGSTRRGDHIVTVQVAVPEKLSGEQKKLLKKLQETGL